MRRLGRATSLLLAPAAAALVGGCGDDRSTGPGMDDVDPLELVIVASDTVRGSTMSLSMSVFSSTGTGADGATFVSLPPGSVARGSSVQILNASSGFVATLPLVAGGFDPLPIPASADDTIRVVVLDGTAVVARYSLSVERRRPPRVVRTDPPPKKRDVALNATMVVVFSEPIDRSSITDATVRLLRGAERVRARLEPHDESGLAVRLVPESPLAARATYTLLVGEGVRDLDGDSLEEALRVDFETGSRVGVLATLRLDPKVATIAPTEPALLLATAHDADWNPLNVPIIWSSADPGVATVDADGVVRGVTLGSTTITASANGMQETARVDVARLTFVSVDAGGEHSCALTSDGEAYCWGGGHVGQLGAGPGVPSGSAPVPVSGGLKFSAISAGGDHSCGLTPEGEAFCWGSNDQGALGSPTTEVCDEFVQPERACSTHPVPVAGGLRFASISAGVHHTCAVTMTELAYCWGLNSFGQLGDGSTSASKAPVAVTGGLRFVGVSAGSSLTCGVAPGGSAYCWGLSHWYGPPYTYAALGNGAPGGPELCAPPVYGGTSFPCSTVPVAVAGAIAFTSISAGWLHACGLDASGTAYCWGGDPGTPSSAPSDLRAGSLHRGIHAALLEGMACLISDDGQPFCWGLYLLGESGPLGGPISGTYEEEPRPLGGDVRLSSISSSWFHGCGLGKDGLAYCWGSSMGGLGNGSMASHAAPRRVLGQR